MSNRIFDILRYLSEVVAPASVTLLGIIFSYYTVNNSEAIIAIVGGVGVFLGALINYKRSQYNKGE